MSDTNGISPRQAEVLALLKNDKTTGEIAERMGITTQGVHGHIRRLRERGHLPEAPHKPRTKSVSIDDTLEPLRTVIARQRDQLQRQDERLLDQLNAASEEIMRLNSERGQVQVALERLQTLELSMEAQQEEAHA